MTVTLAALQAAYGHRWELILANGRWYGVRFCWQHCQDPLHGSRHILLANGLEALEKRLAAVELGAQGLVDGAR
ncbi:hypothetical protein [Nonomuraea sediminis]|uniref:hypothetical protein n=1 Tax=Nonomuraea sediminis TaxID=2835864 RepID=UPI001BDCAC4E|nr:hypothetical protein [Nonomuraea sediminis]